MTREATASGDASVRCFDFMFTSLTLILPCNNTSCSQLNVKSAQPRLPCNSPAIMSAQTPYALTIPEILFEVLDHLASDSATLFAACLVNKAWTEPSLDLLWRAHYWNGMERLRSLPECRRQFYADKIRFLSMDKSPIEYRNLIETLDFPRLRTLEVYLIQKNWYLNHHLVPSLEVLLLSGKPPRAPAAILASASSSL
jgi:hypothetical protein